MQLSNKTAYFSVKINISLHFCVRCKARSMKVYFQIKHLNLSDQSKLIESIIVTVSFSFSLEDFISILSQVSITPYYIYLQYFLGVSADSRRTLLLLFYSLLWNSIWWSTLLLSSWNAQSNMALMLWNSFEIVWSTNRVLKNYSEIIL